MDPAFRVGLFAFPIQQLTNKHSLFNAAESDRQTRVISNRAARIPDKLSKSQSLIDLLYSLKRRGFNRRRKLSSRFLSVPRAAEGAHATFNPSSSRAQSIRVAGVAHTTRCTIP